jgi:eukaryotic-like serine/threonine-protein kinase
VREHEVYAVGVAATALTPPKRLPTEALAELPATTPLGAARPRRSINVRLGVALPIVMAAIIGAGVVVRIQRPSEAAVPVETVTARPAVSAKQAAVEKRQAAREATKREVAQATEDGNAAALLLIVPWGQVIVNGKPRGVSPPLRVLELPPGTHKVEIRNGEFPPYSQQLSVRAGEKVTIRHRFN